MNTNKESFAYPTTTESTCDVQQHAAIREAIGLLASRLRQSNAMANTEQVRQYCMLQIAHLLDEHMGCLFLDNQHRLIHYESLIGASIDPTVIVPRVIARTALMLNAAGVILTHNHPFGLPMASASDIDGTQRLKAALAAIDVLLLDHLIVGLKGTLSFAEKGLL